MTSRTPRIRLAPPAAAARALTFVACAVAVLALAAGPARGQAFRGPKGGHNALAPSDSQPSMLSNVGLDQKLGDVVPGDLVFRDESGREVRLGQYLAEREVKRPVLLSLVYFECPGLCTVVLNELERTLKGVSYTVGESFDVLTVSFDPRETPALAAAKKANYLERYGRPGAEKGWHFLTGDAEPIRRLTDAVGFRYAWDEPRQQFVHTSGLIVLTPDGQVSRYFFGVDYAPRDVRFALQEASGNKIGNPVEKALLYCFQYNPQTGKYGVAISRALKVAGALTVVSIVAFVTLASRRYRTAPVPAEGDEAAGTTGGTDDGDGTGRPGAA